MLDVGPTHRVVMATLKEEAETCRLGVLVGLYSVAEVEAWALRHVETEVHANTAILGVFHSRNELPEDIAAKLVAVAGPDCRAAAVRHLYFDLNRRLHERPDEASLILNMLKALVYIGGADERESSEIDRLDDTFTLAVTGTYGTVSEARKEMALFLDREGASLGPVLAGSN
jgi:hypothetical protein